jgi:hypothetical protein
MLSICAHHASASEEGDYFQILFEEARGAEGLPYLSSALPGPDVFEQGHMHH